MTTSRRVFLKTTAIAGATVAVDGLSAFGEPEGMIEAGTSPLHGAWRERCKTDGIHARRRRLSRRACGPLRPHPHTRSQPITAILPCSVPPITPAATTTTSPPSLSPTASRRAVCLNGSSSPTRSRPALQGKSRSPRRPCADEHHGASRISRAGRHPACRRRCRTGDRPHPALRCIAIPGIARFAQLHRLGL